MSSKVSKPRPKIKNPTVSKSVKKRVKIQDKAGGPSNGPGGE